MYIRNNSNIDLEFVLGSDLSQDDPCELNFSLARVCENWARKAAPRWVDFFSSAGARLTQWVFKIVFMTDT
jgi:hypothetical protein